MTQTNEVATLPTQENALTVFSAAKGLDPYLAAIRAEIDAFTPDISTRKGRDAIASIAHKVARSKTAAAAERKRQADTKAEEERQAAAREADVAHKTTVLKGAKESLMAVGITEEQAVKIVNAIRKGLIPNVTISF